MARIAVIGAGGIGCLLAARAEHCGHDVTVCVRTPIPALRLDEGGTSREIPVRIAVDPAAVGAVDWVILAVKAQDTTGAASWLERLASAKSTVVVAQNGLCHEERVRPYIGEAAILPALVYTAVERLGPGHVIYHSGNGAVVPRGDRGAAFEALFAGSGLDVRQTGDFAKALWRKLLSNTAANPITALTLRRMDVMHEADVLALARELLLETVATARAAGVDLSERDADDVLALHQTYDIHGGTSMLYDRLAGRALEHEYLTGAIVAFADRYGVPVPRNRMILTLLRALRPMR
jgi:2-dehydropantoate 2-reductase